MQPLKRSEIRQVVALVKQRKSLVKSSPFWQALCAELGIGDSSPDGRKISFSATDRELLRQAIRQQSGFDPLLDVLPDAKTTGRVEMSGVISEEKQAYLPVGENRLMVTLPYGTVHINGEACCIPRGTGLWVDWRAVELAPEQSLIIVENKPAFINWHLSNLPTELQSALAVYRGNDLEARALINWQRVIPRERVIGAYDFDPAGLDIAHQRGVAAILVPTQPDRFLGQTGGALHKTSAFAEQHRQHESNRRWIRGEAEQLWRWMEIHGTSITQEAMLEAGETLKLVRF